MLLVNAYLKYKLFLFCHFPTCLLEANHLPMIVVSLILTASVLLLSVCACAFSRSACLCLCQPFSLSIYIDVNLFLSLHRIDGRILSSLYFCDFLSPYLTLPLSNCRGSYGFTAKLLDGIRVQADHIFISLQLQGLPTSRQPSAPAHTHGPRNSVNSGGKTHFQVLCSRSICSLGVAPHVHIRIHLPTYTHVRKCTRKSTHMQQVQRVEVFLNSCPYEPASRLRTHHPPSLSLLIFPLPYLLLSVCLS